MQENTALQFQIMTLERIIKTEPYHLAFFVHILLQYLTEAKPQLVSFDLKAQTPPRVEKLLSFRKLLLKIAKLSILV